MEQHTVLVKLGTDRAKRMTLQDARSLTAGVYHESRQVITHRDGKSETVNDYYRFRDGSRVKVSEKFAI